MFNFLKFSGTLSKVENMGFWRNLVEKDSGTSSKSFFLVATTVVGIILLMVPAIVMLIEVWFNHTITTDLNGMAAYIGSVAALFASAGITKAWSEWSENKFRDRNSEHHSTEEC